MCFLQDIFQTDILEVGKYISIDLSGKNLRIMLLILKGRNNEPEQFVDNYCIPQAVMTGSGEEASLFFLFRQN